MSLPHSPPDAAVRLVLPAQCGTAAAEPLRSDLIGLVAAEGCPVLDAGSVETLGHAVLQLLVAARAERPDLLIAPASPAFAERVHACALGPLLGLAALEA